MNVIRIVKAANGFIIQNDDPTHGVGYFKDAQVAETTDKLCEIISGKVDLPF